MPMEAKANTAPKCPVHWVSFTGGMTVTFHAMILESSPPEHRRKPGSVVTANKRAVWSVPSGAPCRFPT
jgi:hypothetical protein